jgi:uncharacterized protein YkwD
MDKIAWFMHDHPNISKFLIFLTLLSIFWSISFYGGQDTDSWAPWPTNFGSGCVKIWNYLSSWYTRTSDESIRGRAEHIFQRTNEERQKVGLAPYIRDPRLDEMAQEHAKSMHNRGEVDHDGYWWRSDRAKDIGYRYTSENAAISSTDAFISTWMNSPGHSSNILNGTFTHIGVGVYGAYAVQFFAG